MLTKATIFAQLAQHKERLKALGVKRLGLFGSFVRKEERDDSDVDLLVEFEHGQEKFANLMNLYDFLEELFHRRIEVVTIKSLSPYIGPHILKETEYVTLSG